MTVLFLHIPKCSGMALNNTIMEAVGMGMYLRVTGPAWKEDVRLAHAHCYTVIGGHFDWDLPKHWPGLPVITMLRDPVEQIRSLYDFMLVMGDPDTPSSWMEQIGFAAWVDSKHGRSFRNQQTAFLSGHYCREVAVATANLKQPRVTVGLTEHFEESVDRIGKKFGWDLVPQRVNVTKNKTELTPALRKRIASIQHKDMQVYAMAKALFHGGKG